MNRYAVHGMMNSDNDFSAGKIDPTSSLRPGGDDRRGEQPALAVATLGAYGGSTIGGGNVDDADAPPKKKRKSPAVPWKKPVGMPKRPLSSYNLFFASEREKLIARLSAGPEGEEGKAEASSAGAGEEDTTEELYDEGEVGGAAVDDSPVAESPKASPTGRGKKKGRKLGVGFANLAKTIAAKWKTLDSEERAPFEERASVDKKRYDAEVSEWRVKQKAEKAEKKAKAGMSPKQQSLSHALGAEHSPSLSQVGFPEFAAVSDPYPADWFDVQMAPSESRDSAARTLEEAGTFESSQPSAYPVAAAAAATHQQSPLRLGEMQFSAGPLRMIRGSGMGGLPLLQQDRAGSGIQQPSLLDWGASQPPSGAFSSRDMPLAINLEPRYTSQSQSHDALGAHEFAQAMSGQTTSSRPPSPPSWMSSGGWAHQQGAQAFPTFHPQPSSPRNQYEPLPFENPMSVSHYVPYPRSVSMRMPNNSDLMQQHPTGPRRHSEGADARSRQTFGTSLDPMPQLYHPSLAQSTSFSFQQHQQPPHFPVEPRMLSMIHNPQQLEYLQQQQFLQQHLSTTQQTIAGGEQHASTTQPQTASQAGEQPSTGETPGADSSAAPKHQPSEGQQQEPSPSETEGSTFQGISQRLDDDTIDFITRLPFP